MTFNKTQVTNQKSLNEKYENLTISGKGFVNKAKLVITDEQQYLFVSVSLNQGKIVDNDYSNVTTQKFECAVFDQELKKIFISGLFDKIDCSKKGSHIASIEQDESIKGAFSLNGINRVDIIDGKAVIYSAITFCSYLYAGNNLVLDKRKSAPKTN